MSKVKRNQMFVDRKVQGTVVARTTLYWLLSLLTIFLSVICWRIVTGPARMFYTHLDEMWFLYSPVLIALVLLLPILVFDMVAISNRFAGPMVRLRRAMRQAADGETVEPVVFRDNDFWREFADDFNRLLSRLQQQSGTTDAKSVTRRPEGPESRTLVGAGR
jgi:hypothetical protein